MRILKGFAGCWLGLAVSMLIFIYLPLGGGRLHGDTLLAFLFGTAILALVPTLIVGIFEKPSWGPWPYVAIGSALAMAALVAITFGANRLMMPSNVQEWTDFVIAFGCAALTGTMTCGAYRLFAGVKGATPE